MRNDYSFAQWRWIFAQTACVCVNNALHLAVRTHTHSFAECGGAKSDAWKAIICVEQGVLLSGNWHLTRLHLARQTNITLLSKYYQLFVLFDLQRRRALPKLAGQNCCCCCGCCARDREMRWLIFALSPGLFERPSLCVSVCSYQIFRGPTGRYKHLAANERPLIKSLVKTATNLLW